MSLYYRNNSVHKSSTLDHNNVRMKYEPFTGQKVGQTRRYTVLPDGILLRPAGCVYVVWGRF